MQLPAHKDALQKLKQLVEVADISGRHKGFLLLGESGAGKSKTLELFEDWLLEQRQLAEGLPSPLLVVLVPTDSSHKALLSAILARLGDPLASSGTAPALAERVKRFVAQRGIAAIALDEFQHAFEGRTVSQWRVVAQTVKNLVNALQMPIILMGLPAIRGFVEGSSELSQRFKRRALLPELRVSDHSGLVELRQLLKSFDAHEFMAEGVQLDSAEMLPRLFVASRANLGSMVSLIDRACEKAIADKSTHVTLEYFSKAFCDSAEESDGDFDPFKAELQVVKQMAQRLGQRP